VPRDLGDEEWRGTGMGTRIRAEKMVVVVALLAASGREAKAQSVAVPAPAEPAEEHYRLPVSYVERGITNPAKILSPEVDFGVTNFSQTFTTAGPLGSASVTLSQAYVNLAILAGYSITDDFGVRATVVPLEFNSPFAYLGPAVGATYRFLKGDFEMGVAADLTVQTCGTAGCYNPQYGPGNGAGVVFVPSVPMHLHFGKKARLDVQPGIPIANVGAGTTVGLAVPVQFAYDIVEPLHVGAMTGVNVNFVAPNGATVGDTFAIPAGVFGGYAIAGKDGPMLDIDPFVLWPVLFTPASQTGFGKADGAFVDVGVNVTYYLYL
jgi:hypothetical protein